MSSVIRGVTDLSHREWGRTVERRAAAAATATDRSGSCASKRQVPGLVSSCEKPSPSTGGLSGLGPTYLGRHAEAAELLRPMDEAGELFALVGYLDYTFFDPSPFANLSDALRRQGDQPHPAADPLRLPARRGDRHLPRCTGMT